MLTFEVLLLRAHFPPPTIEILAYDENVGSDDLLIGAAEVALEHAGNARIETVGKYQSCMVSK